MGDMEGEVEGGFVGIMQVVFSLFFPCVSFRAREHAVQNLWTRAQNQNQTKNKKKRENCQESVAFKKSLDKRTSQLCHVQYCKDT